MSSMQSYKRRFEYWGWRKQIRRMEALAAHERMKQLGRLQKPTVCQVGQSLLHSDDIEATIQRAREYNLKHPPPTPTPSFIMSIQCRTPSPNPFSPLFSQPNETQGWGSSIGYSESPHSDEAVEYGLSFEADLDQSSRLVPYAESSASRPHRDHQAGERSSTSMNARPVVDGTRTYIGNQKQMSNASVSFLSQKQRNFLHPHMVPHVQLSLTSPRVYHQAEKAIWSVQSLLTHNFETGQQYSEEPRRMCRSRGIRSSSALSGLILDSLDNSLAAFAVGALSHAVAYMSRACSQLIPALHENDASFMSFLIAGLQRYGSRGYSDLVQPFWRHFRDCAKLVYDSDRHPLCSLAESIWTSDSKEDIYSLILSVYAGVFNIQLEPHHYSMLEIRLNQLRSLPDTYSILSWRELLADIERYIGTDGDLYDRCAYLMALRCYAQGLYEEALHIYSPRLESLNGLDLYTAILVAKLQFAHGHRHSATDTLRAVLVALSHDSADIGYKIYVAKASAHLLEDYGEYDELGERFRTVADSFKEEEMRDLEADFEALRLGNV